MVSQSGRGRKMSLGLMALIAMLPTQIKRDV